jgi:hypothetical protein
MPTIVMAQAAVHVQRHKTELPNVQVVHAAIHVIMVSLIMAKFVVRMLIMPQSM